MAADVTCPVCMEVLVEPVVMPCKHELCRACFDRHVQVSSLHCPICRLRIGSWARLSMRAGTLVDKKRSKEVKKLVAQRANRKSDDSCPSSVSSKASADSTKSVLKIAMPGEVHAEYVAEKLKLQAELNEQRQQEEAASEALIRQLIDEDEKERQQRIQEEAAASEAYIKQVLRSSSHCFSESVADSSNRLCDVTGAFGNYASRNPATGHHHRRGGRKPSAAAGSAAEAENEAPASDQASSNCSKLAIQPVNVGSPSSELKMCLPVSLLPTTTHEDGVSVTNSLPTVADCSASARPSLRQRQLDCNKLLTGSRLAACLDARPGSSAATGSGARSDRPSTDVDAPCESAWYTDCFGRGSRDRGSRLQLTKASQSVNPVNLIRHPSSSRSPDAERPSVTSSRVESRGRRGFRGRRFSGLRLPTTNAARAPESPASPNSSLSPSNRMRPLTTFRVGTRGKRYCRDRSFSRLLPPDSGTSCVPESYADCPTNSRGFRGRTSSSRSPDACSLSEVPSCGDPRSDRVPISRPRTLRAAIAARAAPRTSRVAARVGTRGANGRERRSQSLDARERAEHTDDPEPEFYSKPAVSAATVAGETASLRRLSSSSSFRLQQSDAEFASHLQSLYNLEHKYKLNALRIRGSEGEYGLRSTAARKRMPDGEGHQIRPVKAARLTNHSSVR